MEKIIIDFFVTENGIYYKEHDDLVFVIADYRYDYIDIIEMLIMIGQQFVEYESEFNLLLSECCPKFIENFPILYADGNFVFESCCEFKFKFPGYLPSFFEKNVKFNIIF